MDQKRKLHPELKLMEQARRCFAVSLTGAAYISFRISNPLCNFVERMALAVLRIAIGPTDGEEADRFNFSRPPNDLPYFLGLNPTNPAGSQAESLGLQDHVFAGDSEVE